MWKNPIPNDKYTEVEQCDMEHHSTVRIIAANTKMRGYEYIKYELEQTNMANQRENKKLMERIKKYVL